MPSMDSIKSIWDSVRHGMDNAASVVDHDLYAIFNKGMPFKVSEIRQGVGGSRGLNIVYEAPFHSSGVPRNPVLVSLLSDAAKDTNSLVIEGMRTHSAFRGLGLGRQVASNIFDFARHAGYDGVRCLAGESHGIAFWPRFMRISDESATVYKGMHGLDSDHYSSLQDLKDSVQWQINYYKEYGEKYNWEKIDFDGLGLTDTSDPDWFDRVLQFDKGSQKTGNGYSFLNIDQYNPAKANMVSDFSNPQDAERARSYFSHYSAPDQNLGYLRRIDSLLSTAKSTLNMG